MKVKKIIVIFLIVYVLINTFNILNTKVYAISRFEDMVNSAKNFTEDDSATTTVPIPITVDKLQAVSKTISSILFVIAIGVALVTVTVTGINLMIQSAEEKAKTKEALVPLVIGMIISFGAYGIWKIMVGILAEL